MVAKGVRACLFVRCLRSFESICPRHLWRMFSSVESGALPLRRGDVGPQLHPPCVSRVAPCERFSRYSFPGSWLSKVLRCLSPAESGRGINAVVCCPGCACSRLLSQILRLQFHLRKPDHWCILYVRPFHAAPCMQSSSRVSLVVQVSEALGLPDIRSRQWSIQEASALKGKGLFEGFDW